VFVALVIQHAYAPYCHLWPARLYQFFPHYLIKDTIFWEKLFDTNNTIFWEKLFDIKCVFLFCLEVLSEAFLILRRNERDIIIKVLRSSCKVPLLFLFDFVLNLNFLNKKYKIYKIKIYE